MVFILLFGMVSLFSDMTHEGAASIRGAYLSLLGASAGVIGFVSGLGELTGYSLRYLFGRWADRTKQYWTMTIGGYVLDVIAVPALALVGENGWVAACGLLLFQRLGKAIKKPAKDTLMSFAASQTGTGKSFGIQELLDQIGAFLGPVLLYLVMLKPDGGGSFPYVCALLRCPGRPGSDYALSPFCHEAQISPSGAVRAGAEGVHSFPDEKGIHPVYRRNQPFRFRIY